MAYEILEHTADAGVRGIGNTLEEAFREAARGTFSLMVDLERVELRQEVALEVQADSLEGLLVAFLGELLAKRDIEGLVFSDFKVKIGKGKGGWRLTGVAWGEPLDPARHRPGVEVKAATYFGVRVEKEGHRWIAQCVLDL
ncbi:MAG TPA: archease [Candidatus Acetothermia bacterium]|nr:archease [Candidatus Acetothermia bacterium]